MKTTPKVNVIPVGKPAKLDAGIRTEPTIESPAKPDDLKTLIELLASQGDEIAKLTRVIHEANDRLATLEATKPKVTRKSPAKASAPAPGMGAFPPAPDPSQYGNLPPVTGGFEPVH